MEESGRAVWSVSVADSEQFAADTVDSKRSSEYFDPCQEFANKSIKCLHRNGGDKEMCIDYFQYVR